MNIGWLIPVTGCFGAVREVVEVSNVFVRRGHSVTLYHPDEGPVTWLDCLTAYGTVEDLADADLDVLIGIPGWQPALFEAFCASPARLKALPLLGFTPNEAMAAQLRGDVPATDRAPRMIRQAVADGVLILADAQWQLDWIGGVMGIETGPPFGGVNLALFHPQPKPQRRRPRLVYSGDPRDRKGTDTVEKAIALICKKMAIEAEAYWGKRLSQPALARFYAEADLFLDGHRRGGWCNPVAEAMACGTAVVCTNIGATASFAFDGETALTVDVDDAESMAQKALSLLKDDTRRQTLARNALHHIRTFDYEVVAPRLEAALLARLEAEVAPL